MSERWYIYSVQPCGCPGYVSAPNPTPAQQQLAEDAIFSTDGEPRMATASGMQAVYAQKCSLHRSMWEADRARDMSQLMSELLRIRVLE